MRRFHTLRRTSRRRPVRAAQLSSAESAIATLSVFAAIAAGTAAAVAIDAPHPAGVFGGLVVGATTLVAVPLVASVVRRRLAAVATDANRAGLESSSGRPGPDRTAEGSASESDRDGDGSVEASATASFR